MQGRSRLVKGSRLSASILEVRGRGAHVPLYFLRGESKVGRLRREFLRWPIKKKKISLPMARMGS